MITPAQIETQQDLAKLLRAAEVDRLTVRCLADTRIWRASATRGGITVHGEAASRQHAIERALQLVAEVALG